jgi:uncharacterized protein
MPQRGTERRGREIITAMQIEIRQALPGDLSAVYEINEASVPHVTSISMVEMKTLAAQCCYFGVAWLDGCCGGFLLALRPGEDYASPHYRWFSQKYHNFVYVDRIAVAPTGKGLGVGRALYADLERAVTPETQLITCEVNLMPPNPDSIAFHVRLGFEEVGQLESEGGKKRVSLMAKKLGGV